MNIFAVSGWALPAEWFREQVREYFPSAQVKCFYPRNPFVRDEAVRELNTHRADLYIGYSMGSLWLMKYRDLLPPDSVKALLAPILAFLKERDMGGKTGETQLKYFIKILKRNSRNKNSALLDFYSSCDFPFSRALIEDIPDAETLIRGLEFLATESVSEEACCTFKAITGEKDIFLDAKRLKNLIPHLEVVDSAGHSPSLLLERLASLVPPGYRL
ncbi:MAG: hypothetical protein COV67_03920 [Nitrospinae bacterium CG11_big_fil_rev_8_21_14_0_20_56_8]|nr:MAG: hypothetical protein COV67_03920 [Nitrospinae bacterium CG11_big_fil_rev_8_21_14_0_20_56_8]